MSYHVRKVASSGSLATLSPKRYERTLFWKSANRNYGNTALENECNWIVIFYGSRIF
jgi:hypothetical protein